MILGLGTDIVEIERIEKALRTHGHRFINRLFTKAEQDYCDEKPHFRAARYAKRFCAKEAFLKALGTGRSHGITWKDVEVTRDDSGKPSVFITGKALEILSKKSTGQIKTHLSLSDTKEIATATVIIEEVL